MEASIVKIPLVGRIDSNNSAELEKQIQEQLAGKGTVPVELDAEGLSVTGVNSTVYEILEMTGFTEMMTVEKAYRIVSIDGCEEIGRGANGTIYRIDQDNVVKVYNNTDALAEIQNEREMAKLALILGVPTAISYDVVKVGNSYGSVFELLNARSFSRILTDEPQKLDWCVEEFVNLLKKSTARSSQKESSRISKKRYCTGCPPCKAACQRTRQRNCLRSCRRFRTTTI